MSRINRNRTLWVLSIPLALLLAPGIAEATCMEQLRSTRAVQSDCTDLKGKLPAGAPLHFSAVWEVCCSAPPSPDAGTGPDISCAQYPGPTYFDPTKEFRLWRLETGAKQKQVAGKIVSLKQCGEAGHFRFDGKLTPGVKYRLTYQNSTALEIEVAMNTDGGYLMDCLAGDGAPPEDPSLADRGCSVGAPAAGALPALLLLALLAWRRRVQ